MKSVLIFATLFLFSFKMTVAQTNPLYDSVLARQLNADDYGMKMYVLVLLKPGTNNETNAKVRDSLFSGHMANINRLVKAGNLILAGPFGKNDKYSGLFIFNSNSIDDTKKMLQTDPVISSHILDAELYNWYGSAALSEYLKVHDKIEKQKH